MNETAMKSSFQKHISVPQYELVWEVLLWGQLCPVYTTSSSVQWITSQHSKPLILNTGDSAIV